MTESPTPADTQDAGPPNEPQASMWSFRWMRWVIALLAIVLSAEAAWLGLQHLLPQLLMSKLAVVDVNDALDERRLQFVKMLSAPDVTDAQRSAAYDFVRQSSQDTNAALQTVIAGCNCIVLSKAAVLNGGALRDLTPDVKKAMAQPKAAP